MGSWECPKCGSEEKPDLFESRADVTEVLKCVNCHVTLDEENYTPTDEDFKAVKIKRLWIICVCVFIAVLNLFAPHYFFKPLMFFVVLCIGFLIYQNVKISGVDLRIAERKKNHEIKTLKQKGSKEDK